MDTLRSPSYICPPSYDSSKKALEEEGHRQTAPFNKERLADDEQCGRSRFTDLYFFQYENPQREFLIKNEDIGGKNSANYRHLSSCPSFFKAQFHAKCAVLMGRSVQFKRLLFSSTNE